MSKCDIDKIVFSVLAICPNMSSTDLLKLTEKSAILKQILKENKYLKFKYPSVIVRYLQRNKKYVIGNFEKQKKSFLLDKVSIMGEKKRISKSCLVIKEVQSRGISNENLLKELKSDFFIQILCSKLG